MDRFRCEEEESARPVEIVVATFADPGEAQAAAGILVDSGLEARVAPIAGPRISADGSAANVRFAISLPPADVRKAIELLQQKLASPGEPALELDLEHPLELPAEPMRCPECGSDQVRGIPTVRLAIAGVVLLTIIGWVSGEEDLFYLAAAIVGLILVLGPNHRCLRCGNRWMD